MERCVSLLTMTSQWKAQRGRREASADAANGGGTGPSSRAAIRGASVSTSDMSSLETPVDYSFFGGR